MHQSFTRLIYFNTILTKIDDLAFDLSQNDTIFKLWQK